MRRENLSRSGTYFELRDSTFSGGKYVRFVRANRLSSNRNGNLSAKEKRTRAEGLEELWICRATSSRLQPSVVSKSNDEALVMLDERRKQLELISLAIHHVKEACRVTDSLCCLQRGVPTQT